MIILRMIVTNLNMFGLKWCFYWFCT